jgi:pilus assembly protein Flp/PilA
MSDLTDKFRNACIDLYFGARRERGQTAAEYMGVLLVISVIIATIATTNIGSDIVSKMSDLVGKIASGTSGTGQ